jgi:hypothetical protein
MASNAMQQKRNNNYYAKASKIYNLLAENKKHIFPVYKKNSGIEIILNKREGHLEIWYILHGGFLFGDGSRIYFVLHNFASKELKGFFYIEKANDTKLLSDYELKELFLSIIDVIEIKKLKKELKNKH